MAQPPVVARDSAGLPIPPPSPTPAPLFAEITPEDGSELEIYFGAKPNNQRGYRRLRRKVRREKALGEIDSQDRWLISYSDFITLLFAFFVVMYAISQVNESKYRVLSESLVQAFKPQGNLEAKSIVENKLGQPSATPVPAGVVPQMPPRPEIPKQPPLPKLQDVELEVKKELDPLIKTGEIRVLSGTQGLSIELNTKVSFKPGEASMTFESFLPLKNVARILSRNANMVRVEGYVGSERISSEFATAWELSTARASRVVRYFADSGIDPQRLSALGYGDTRAGQGGNTRLGILILPISGEAAPKESTVQPDGSTTPNIKELN